MNTTIHAYLEELKRREEAATKGPWIESFWRAISENPTHVVCYTGTNNATRTEQAKQDAAFIASARQDIPKLRAIVECLLEAVEETWGRCEMGYIIGDGEPSECGECGEKASRVSETVIHQPDCFQGKIEDALTRVGQMVESQP